MHRLDRDDRIEQRQLAGARRTASLRDPGDGAAGRQYHRAAGRPLAALGVPDEQARDRGQARICHGSFLSWLSPGCRRDDGGSGGDGDPEDGDRPARE